MRSIIISCVWRVSLSLSPALDSLVSVSPRGSSFPRPQHLPLSCLTSNFMLIKFCQNIEMLSWRTAVLPGWLAGWLGKIWWEKGELFLIRRAGSVLAERSNGRQTERFIILTPSVINTQYEYTHTTTTILSMLHYWLSLSSSRLYNNNCMIQLRGLDQR